MKILVAIKRVLDYNLKVRIKNDKSGVDLANLKMSINPFDEIALEEALRLKEAGLADEIIAVSCGAMPCQETLRSALAMGADRAILMHSTEELEPLAVAKLLKFAFVQEQATLFLLGKQAIDDDSNQTGQMLAAILGVGQATFASKVSLNGDSLTVTREVDGGLETLILSTPAIITVDLRLNEPRYISLPNIMKAKKKPLQVIEADSLTIDVAPRVKILQVVEPPQRQAGVILESVADLANKVREILPK